MKPDAREKMARCILTHESPSGKKPARQLGDPIGIPQCDPEHYKAGKIETIDVLEDFVSIDNRKTYTEAEVRRVTGTEVSIEGRLEGPG